MPGSLVRRRRPGPEPRCAPCRVAGSRTRALAGGVRHDRPGCRTRRPGRRAGRRAAAPAGRRAGRPPGAASAVRRGPRPAATAASRPAAGIGDQHVGPSAEPRPATPAGRRSRRRRGGRHTGQQAARQSVARASARSSRPTPGGGCRRDLAAGAALDGHDEVPPGRPEAACIAPIVAMWRACSTPTPGSDQRCTLDPTPTTTETPRDRQRHTRPCPSPTACGGDRASPDAAAHEARLARHRAPPDDRRLRRLPQPPLLRRPVHVRATSSTTTATRRTSSARSEVFRIPVVGAILRGAEQIPVYRNTGRAADAFRAAVAAVDAGKCVGVYPEGTLTRDPDLWPMVGKTGAARIALTTSCPVDPRRPVGSAGDARALLQEAAPAPAHDHADARRVRRSTSATCTTSRSTGDVAARGDRPHRRRRSRASSRASAARRRRPSGSTRASTGCPRPRATSTAARGRAHDQGRGLRDGQLGHGVCRGAGRRGHDRDACGADARRSSTRSTPAATRTTCPGSALPRGHPGHGRPGRGRGRRRHRRPRRAVADPARQPRRRGSRTCRRTRRSCR